ncbi:MAG: phosphoribosylaminoimidazolesuccinocarboxamide synthase, partial [Coriobacteriia bacterium]|nr:phosphoribosylaminoimidazolesuccinocarboxamide synthase [Coriobacteriia bacterium]
DAAALKNLSLAVYSRARSIASTKGIIIADTKFEFGKVPDSNGAPQIILADEVLTPDSSRFWPMNSYEPGKDQPSFDKQFVRDWLVANWDRKAAPDNPPPLPPQIIEQTSQKYLQAYEMLTDEKFTPAVDLL